MFKMHNYNTRMMILTLFLAINVASHEKEEEAEAIDETEEGQVSKATLFSSEVPPRICPVRMTGVYK